MAKLTCRPDGPASSKIPCAGWPAILTYRRRAELLILDVVRDCTHLDLPTWALQSTESTFLPGLSNTHASLRIRTASIFLTLRPIIWSIGQRANSIWSQ